MIHNYETTSEELLTMEFAVHTIGNKIQVSLYEDEHKFCDFRLTMDEAEIMVRKLNMAISILRLKSKTKPYAKPLEVLSTEHTENGLT